MKDIRAALAKFPYNGVFFKFLYSGAVMRGISIVLNYFFAEFLALNIRLVYFFVLTLDFFIGYLFNRFFVFNQSFERSHKSTLVAFLIGGISFRALDWIIYVLLVEKAGFYLVAAQVTSILCIMGLKFLVYRKIFR